MINKNYSLEKLRQISICHETNELRRGKTYLNFVILYQNLLYVNFEFFRDITDENLQNCCLGSARRPIEKEKKVGNPFEKGSRMFFQRALLPTDSTDKQAEELVLRHHDVRSA